MAANQQASKAVKRVYLVTETIKERVGKDQSDPLGKEVERKVEHLVEAGSRSQAIAHIVRGRFSAEAASVADAIRLRDVEVQKAGVE